MRGTFIEVEGFTLDPGLLYDAESHMWVEQLAGDRCRVGFDPLGRETSGDIVSLSFVATGSAVARGESFGDVEAAKLVGPLRSPVCGTVHAHNSEALTDPGAVNHDPLGTWLVEMTLDDSGLDRYAAMVTGEALPEWFAGEVRAFRERGMIAE